MKYICPTCGKEFNIEEEVSKHFLKCWKEQNPHHKSKPAPRSENKMVSEGSENIIQFLAALERNNNNE